MRRSGSSATVLAAAAAVTTRQIESWTLNKLGPLPSASREQQVDHFRALSGIVGPGRGNNADRAALRLAAHGFACGRLREALLRTVWIPEVGEVPQPIDLDDDVAFAALEQCAFDMVQEIDQLPVLFRTIIGEIRRNVRQVGAKTGKTADDILRSAFVNLMCVLRGGALYDVTPIAAMFGVPASDVDPSAVDVFNDVVRVTVWEIDDTYRTVDLYTLVKAAVWLRGAIAGALDQISVEVSDPVVDELAAIAAPFLIRLVWTLAAHPEFGETLVGDAGLPTEVLVPQRSLAELQHR